jgi:hypothetical protein
VCVQVLHGDMHDVAQRLLTFASDFPHTEPPLTPEVMVQTGLFSQPLEPGSDRVICSACGVVLEGWQPGQVPAFVHFAASPHCRLLQWPDAPPPAATADSPHRAPPAASPLFHEPELEPPAAYQPIQGWGQMLAQAGTAYEVVPPGRVLGGSVCTPQQHQQEAQGGGGGGKEEQHSSAEYPRHPRAASSAQGCLAVDPRALEARVAARPSVVTWWPLGARRMPKVDAAVRHTSGGEWAVAAPLSSGFGTPRSPPGGRGVTREESGAGVWGAATEDEAGGVGVLEMVRGGVVPLDESSPLGGSVGRRARASKISVARDLLEAPSAEQALLALSSCADKQVQGLWYRLLAALAHAAGPSKEFESMCLPRLLLGITTCKDEARLVLVLDALRCLALQPRCRKYLATGAGYDTICALVNALPKWSARNLEMAYRAGGAPSDVWPRLLENVIVVLQHMLVALNADDAHGNHTLRTPQGATAAVLCVLREAPFEHAEVQRGAVANNSQQSSI